MMIDFALEAERVEGKSSLEAIYQAWPVAASSDHDDDDGGAAGSVRSRWERGWGRSSAAPSASRSSGADRQPGPHAYTTPVIYLYLDGVRLWFQRLRVGRPAAERLRAGGSREAVMRWAIADPPAHPRPRRHRCWHS